MRHLCLTFTNRFREKELAAATLEEEEKPKEKPVEEDVANQVTISAEPVKAGDKKAEV